MSMYFTFFLLTIIALDSRVNRPSGGAFDLDGFHYLSTALVIALETATVIISELYNGP